MIKSGVPNTGYFIDPALVSAAERPARITLEPKSLFRPGARKGVLAFCFFYLSAWGLIFLLTYRSFINGNSTWQALGASFVAAIWIGGCYLVIRFHINSANRINEEIIQGQERKARLAMELYEIEQTLLFTLRRQGFQHHVRDSGGMTCASDNVTVSKASLREAYDSVVHQFEDEVTQ